MGRFGSPFQSRQMGWVILYIRRLRIFAMALALYLDYKIIQLRQKWTNKSKIASLWEMAHERNAKRILTLIVNLEGLWVKFGQYLSTRADVLPPAYTSRLWQLQDSLPPRPLYEIRQTIHRELGQSIDDLFSYFDITPLGTASVAQVHRATLTNGQKVVVKVQHAGIKATILQDLMNAKSIVNWIAWAEPESDFSPMVDEWCKEAPKELDFNHEAENTRKVSRNLGCKNKDKSDYQLDVIIPDIILSTEKVLILEYIDGIRLNDTKSLEAFGVNTQKIVEEITRAYAHQIYVDGFFNGDPHPGNFLVSKEPPHRPVLLDFGLTKELSLPIKQALAKLFLAAVEWDYVALLSALSEMGLRLRLDVPEQAMEVASIFFRNSNQGIEIHENTRPLPDQRMKNMKVIEEKTNLTQKQAKHFNPVDAFPGDIVIFTRVLNLLRGLSSTLNARIVYMDIMRPFAESVLEGSFKKEPALNPQWICDTSIHSNVEARLRQLLIELGNNDKILGIQVCAYKDGKVVVDTAAGMLGKYDPRPVKPDSLFPVFSATKGITAGMLHWLVDKGKLRLEESVSNVWPEFASRGKDSIKVYHVLNHTSGLHNALAELSRENPFALVDWDECLTRIAMTTPETEPGQHQLYHYLSFGWLCGGTIEHASGKKFQEILEEAFIRPLKIEGELYIGIPPGVESRLASLAVDMDDLSKFPSSGRINSDMPSSFQPEEIAQFATSLPALFNMLQTRRAILPAANGHCSARALARYYAALADGGTVPPPHSASSKPPLGSHPHTPKFPSRRRPTNNSRTSNVNPTGSRDIEGGHHSRRASTDSLSRFLHLRKYSHSHDDDSSISDSNGSSYDSEDKCVSQIFSNTRIQDAFMGAGEYVNLIKPGGRFGLGFRRVYSKDGSLIGFGHSGMGGSTGYCDIQNRFAISVTVNKMSFGAVTAKIIQLVCSELNIPVPEDYADGGSSSSERPLIN